MARNKKHSKRLLFAAYCLVFFAGCASLPPAAPTLAKDEAGGGKTSDELDACFDTASISLLQKKYENIKTLKGTALLKIVSKDNKDMVGRAAIIIKRPDQFRMEILGPFNQTVFLITYNKKSVSLFSFQENKVYRDYPLPVEASLFPQYLSGLPAAGVGNLEIDNMHPILSHGRCVYTNSGDERILLNREGNILEIALSGATDDIYPIKVSMNSYKEIDGFNFPFEISLNNKKADIIIKYDHIEINHDILDDLFNLPDKREIEDISAAPLKKL